MAQLHEDVREEDIFEFKDGTKNILRGCEAISIVEHYCAVVKKKNCYFFVIHIYIHIY